MTNMNWGMGWDRVGFYGTTIDCDEISCNRVCEDDGRVVKSQLDWDGMLIKWHDLGSHNILLATLLGKGRRKHSG